MNNQNADPTGNTNDAARLVSQLQQANQALTQQLAERTADLKQLQMTLREAERKADLERRNDAEQTQLLTRERELHELKSNFVTLASHEFRTPMMTIMSSASLIGCYTTEADAEKRERHVQRIKSAVNSLTRILDDFLSISRMDLETVHSQPYPLDLLAFCPDVLSEAQAVARPTQQFVYDHVAGPSQISLDGQLLKNILLNLLTNASKYSGDNTTIILTSSVHDDQLIMAVKDHGIGIPDVDKGNLFTNFFRGRNAIHIQGTGLGLYLVKRYVDLLGGTVSFTSQLNEGTVFTVQLPLTAASV